MSILVFAIVICVACTWLIRHFAGNDDLRDGLPAVARRRPRDAGPDGVIADAEWPAWTALDDHQLNRFLKDSSP